MARVTAPRWRERQQRKVSDEQRQTAITDFQRGAVIQAQLARELGVTPAAIADMLQKAGVK